MANMFPSEVDWWICWPCTRNTTLDLMHQMAGCYETNFQYLQRVSFNKRTYQKILLLHTRWSRLNGGRGGGRNERNEKLIKQWGFGGINKGLHFCLFCSKWLRLTIRFEWMLLCKLSLHKIYKAHKTFWWGNFP